MKLNKRQIQLLLILIVIAAVFSMIVFLIPFYKGGVFWVAYCFELLSIALQIPVFKVAFDNTDKLNSKVLGFPVFRIGYLYLGIQTLVSIVLFILGTFERFPTWTATVLCLLLFAVAIICSISADIARDAVEQIDTVKEIGTSRMMTIRSLTLGLPTLTTDPTLRSALNSLADEFRYSDPVSSNATERIESEIEDKVLTLSDRISGGNITLEEIQEIRNLLVQRNVICKSEKH